VGLQRRAVEVDVFPHAADSLPNASLFRCRSDNAAASIRRLHQANVYDYGGIAHDTNVGTADRDRRSLAGRGGRTRRIREIGAMERQTLNQVPASLGLNRRDILGTDFGVGRPVATKNRGQQFFGGSKDFSGG